MRMYDIYMWQDKTRDRKGRKDKTRHAMIYPSEMLLQQIIPFWVLIYLVNFKGNCNAQKKYTFGNNPLAALNNQNITINEHGE